MKSVQLFIEGKFEEAWLYMNHLLLLTDNGDVLLVSADQMRDRLQSKTSASRLAGVSLFHSDWIYPSRQYQYIWANRLRKQLRSQVKKLPEAALEVSLRQLDLQHFEIPSSAHTPLDVHIYSRRVYLGSAGGLFSVDVEWGDKPAPIDDWRHRLDAMCSSVTAKYGAFVASCGKDGLLSSVENVYWLAPYELADDEVRKIRDESRRASWIESNLINYSYEIVEVLHAHRELIDQKKNVQILRGFEKGALGISEPLHMAVASGDEGVQDAEIIGNVGNRFAILDAERNLSFISVAPRKIRHDEIVLTREERVDVGQVHPLDFLGLKDGFLLEHYDGVGWIKGNRYVEVIPTGVGKIRTFPSSIRYRNVFTAITNEGVLLVGLFDEDQFTPPQWD
jgi:hypothetical protein